MKKTNGPSTDSVLEERAQLLNLVEQNQQQTLLAQQRIAFLNGILTERGVDLNQSQNFAEPAQIRKTSNTPV